MSDISTTATVVTQPSAEQPLEVALRVTNEHDIPVRLVPTDHDRMLKYMPPLEGATVDLRMLPAEVGYSVVPNSRMHGCWRLDAESPEDARASVPYIVEPMPEVLEPNQTYSIRHEVYHNGSSDTCFPDGEYVTTKSLFFSEELEHAIYRYEDQLAFDVQYRLSVSNGGTATIAAEGPSKRSA